jgi:hypothetical protein
VKNSLSFQNFYNIQLTQQANWTKARRSPCIIKNHGSPEIGELSDRVVPKSVAHARRSFFEKLRGSSFIRPRALAVRQTYPRWSTPGRLNCSLIGLSIVVATRLWSSISAHRLQIRSISNTLQAHIVPRLSAFQFPSWDRPSFLRFSLPLQ